MYAKCFVCMSDDEKIDICNSFLDIYTCHSEIFWIFRTKNGSLGVNGNPAVMIRSEHQATQAHTETCHDRLNTRYYPEICVYILIWGDIMIFQCCRNI
jgi:hypothetical protein